MSKVTAYLLITDTHFHDSSIQSRIDHRGEMEELLTIIESNVLKYKDSCDQVVVIFLGDVFDRSLVQIFESLYFQGRIIKIRMMCDLMLGVLGNHETTYYKDNPFWTLVQEIHSTRIPQVLKKMWQPLGVMPVMELHDTWEDGNVRFIFNHHGCGIQQAPQDKINIGLFHQDLYAKAIVEDMRANKGLGIYEHSPSYFDSGSPLNGYAYAYFAHAHLFYGKWKYTCEQTQFVTNIEYLGSLFRTKETEIKDSFLERNIPCVLIRDGELDRIEDNKFLLRSRAQTVNEDIVERNKILSEKAKERKHSMEIYTQVHDDPVKNLKSRLSATPMYVSMIAEILETGKTSVESEIDRLLGGYL